MGPATQRQSARRLAVLQHDLAVIRRFLSDDVWDHDVTGLSGARLLLFSFCRICVIVVRGFLADNCGLQASALTYITLMSLIPVLALMFSFSKGIGMQNYLIDAVGLERVEAVVPAAAGERVRVEFRVASRAAALPGEAAARSQFALDGLPEPMQKVVTTVFSYVENTSFGALGLVGSLLLFWGVIRALSKLEESFNAIWGVKVPRPLFRRFTEYFFVLALVPVLFVVVTSVNACLSAPAAVEQMRVWVGPLAWLYVGVLRLFGGAVVVLAFTFLFKFMPNTDVKTLPALAGGAVGGALWYVTQWAYITFQIGITSYNAIYGTFAAVPFFLAWLYTNWTIVLFGAEVSFAVQNYRTYILEGSPAASSPASRVCLGIVLTFETCKAYMAGEHGWRPAEFARQHAIPVRLVATVVASLVADGILVPVDLGGDRDRCYVPGRPPYQLSLADIESAVRANDRRYTGQLMVLVPESVATALTRNYEHFIADLSKVTFRSLVEQGSGKPPTAG